MALGAYATYWLVLRRLLPRGRPVSDPISGRDHPNLRQLFFWVAAVELAVVFVAPWAAAAVAGGAWRAALQYFGPIALMTVLNIAAEGLCRKSGHVLAVFGSTGINNLYRICAYYAALLDMQAALAAGGGAAAAAAPLRLLAWAGVVVSVAIILIFEPVPVYLVPLKQHQEQPQLRQPQ